MGHEPSCRVPRHGRSGSPDRDVRKEGSVRRSSDAMKRGRTVGPGGRTRRRPLRRSASLCALGLAVALGGCATKNDLKQLRDQVVVMQARQDSLFRLLEQQNRDIIDSLRAGGELMMLVRGELGYQL